MDAGAKGIVIAAAGAGATAPGQSEGLDYAASKGVVRRDGDADRQRADRGRTLAPAAAGRDRAERRRRAAAGRRAGVHRAPRT